MIFFLPSACGADSCAGFVAVGGTACGALRVGGTSGVGEDGRETVGIGGTGGRDGCFGSALTVTSG